MTIIIPSFIFLFRVPLSPLSIITLLPLEGKNISPSSPLPLLAATMSGLYSQGFSPARTLSPQIRSNPDADRYY